MTHEIQKVVSTRGQSTAFIEKAPQETVSRYERAQGRVILIATVRVAIKESR